MDLSAFSRLGGKARSPAKTAANRAKIRIYWQQVRQGDAKPPRHRRRFPSSIRALAKQYIWWESPSVSLRNPVRVVAQVMDMGTYEDGLAIRRYFGKPTMRRALEQAVPGWFKPRSWTYWHYVLGLRPWGEDVPPLPVRKFE